MRYNHSGSGHQDKEFRGGLANLRDRFGRDEFRGKDQRDFSPKRRRSRSRSRGKYDYRNRND